MSKVLVLFAHPMLDKSRAQKALLQATKDLEGVYVHDLYEVYPNFDIDADHEQKLLMQHDILVMQHPFYWYSVPPILKQWIDLVLEHGWAYGRQGNALKGKYWMHALSTGGPKAAYSEGGFNKYTIGQFLAPYEQTARLCNMQYLPPFVMHATHLAGETERAQHALQYRKLLELYTSNEIQRLSEIKVDYANEWIPVTAPKSL